jgi:hypothetical protein
VILSYYAIDLVSSPTALLAYTFLTVDGRRIYDYNHGTQSSVWQVQEVL